MPPALPFLAVERLTGGNGDPLSDHHTPEPTNQAGHTDLKSRDHYDQHRFAGGGKEAERRSPQGISVCKQVKPGGPVP